MNTIFEYNYVLILFQIRESTRVGFNGLSPIRSVDWVLYLTQSNLIQSFQDKHVNVLDQKKKHVNVDLVQK